jgi:hypothetical protein
MDLQGELGPAEDQVRLSAGADVGVTKRDRFVAHALGVGVQLERANHLKAAAAEVPLEGVWVAAPLHDAPRGSERFDAPTGADEHLVGGATVARRLPLLFSPQRDRRQARHDFAPAGHTFVRPQEQLDLLLQGDSKGVLGTGRFILTAGVGAPEQLDGAAPQRSEVARGGYRAASESRDNATQL